MPPFLVLINGALVREDKIDPEWSLAYFLREKLRLVGTKIACGQGACGSCTVFISRYNKEDDSFHHHTANACVTPIVSCHGSHVMTIENLSSKETNTCHAFQEAIAKGNGSQCGYCIPGMVMSMFGMTMNNSSWDIARVKKIIQGNLCRCTGYRPILEAFRKCKPSKKLDNIPDIEDIDIVVNENCMEKQRFISCDSSEDQLSKIEELMRRLRKDKPHSFQNVEFQGPKVKWFQPTSLLELTSCFARNPDARLVSGCTSEEFRPEQPGFLKCSVIQISRLKELHSYEVYDNHICIGAGLSVAEIERHLNSTLEKLPDWKCRSIKSILMILRRFASVQIRNAATIGGCLSVQSNASDLQTLANAFEFSALCFNPVSQAHTEIKAAFPQSFARSIIVNVKIPFTTQQEYTWAYKLSRRRFFDRAVMNVAVKTEVRQPEGEKDAKITKVSLAYGGSTIRRFSLQFSYEKNPRNLTADLFGQITEEISKTIHINVNTPIYSGRYLAALASNLFKKFYEHLQDCLYPPPTSLDSGSNPDDLALLEFSSMQIFGEVDADQSFLDLVGRPVPHPSALKHATGEARYCDDIAKYENELSIALVLSERAHAVLKKVDPTKGLMMDGVVGFLSHHDLAEGKNAFGVLVQDEEIFASTKVHCVGQIIGAIVARDRFTAKKAAKVVTIEYQDVEPCILTIEEAITHGSYFENHGAKLVKGDCERIFQGTANILSGKLNLGGQLHFYMETQSCIAVPTGEDGTLEIISATQNLTDTQLIIANALGLNANQVTVTVKRIGGGFGGKDTRSLLVALPAALAAKKFGRPARCVLSRKTDMMISGKREPYAANYQIGFSSSGQLLAVKMYIYANAGCSLDASFVGMERAVINIDNAYNIPNLDIEGKLCRTNRPSNTTFRGPGTTQGAYFIESILDRIAAHLGKEPAEIRQINMYQEGDMTPYGQILENCTLERCWEECLEMSQYFDRKRSAEFFNSTQLYRKRGLYITPCHFGIGYTHIPFNQAGAIVIIYKDGSVLLNHGGVELGQGIHCKMIQIATRVLNIPASKIRIENTSTDKIPNTTPTSASLSSDLNGMAIMDACQQLSKRLEPYRKSMSHATWDEIVAQAYLDRVSLSVTGFYKDTDVSWSEYKQGNVFAYFTSGAACSEVEVDCLTGEYQILRTDIVMDAGKSLNPAIDIGQIEGAFMQGVGLFTLEELITDKAGHLQTTGPLTYKIPTALDIPLEFNVAFLPGSGNPRAIYSSKTVGEPPLLLANSVYFAIKDAVRQFRKQLGWGSTFRMDSPASVEKVLAACSNLSHFDVEHH
ncbi:unnamed protein product [Orchesella dallaii]|uniref:Xanthine dehydrogenase n=1 Tax=Orchesella dallaii TaxID=48710 RepID=A0ABP1Q5E6_9HEXA